MKFARLFERPAGQILAVLTNMEEDDTPAVILTWLPSPEHCLAHLNVLFERSNKGARDALRFFESLTLERACEAINQGIPSRTAEGNAMPEVTHTAPRKLQ